MGYTTDFFGEFQLDKELTPEHAAYLKAFSDTRRMQRDPKKAAKLPDPTREAAGLPIGAEGAYFVGGTGLAGQDEDPSIIDYNEPPCGQPGLWCHWQATEDLKGIEWDGGEKFYEYIAWIEYLINHFLRPWGYTVSGQVEWQGEERDDHGRMVVVANTVRVQRPEVTWVDQ